MRQLGGPRKGRGGAWAERQGSYSARISLLLCFRFILPPAPEQSQYFCLPTRENWGKYFNMSSNHYDKIKILSHFPPHNSPHVLRRQINSVGVLGWQFLKPNTRSKSFLIEEFHFPGPTETQPRGQTSMLSIILWVKCLEESCQHRTAVSMRIRACGEKCNWPNNHTDGTPLPLQRGVEAQLKGRSLSVRSSFLPLACQT